MGTPSKNVSLDKSGTLTCVFKITPSLSRLARGMEGINMQSSS